MSSLRGESLIPKVRWSMDLQEMDAGQSSKSGCLKTVSGRYVDLLEPQPETIELFDIAHGLSFVCRFGGHVPAFYSVAEHSMHVAAQVRRTFGDDHLALYGLLHDATEAFLGDVVRPLKLSMDAYRAVEELFARAIESRFSLPAGSLDDERVKATDKAILPWEMAMVRDCPFRTANDPTRVRDAFVALFFELGGHA